MTYKKIIFYKIILSKVFSVLCPLEIFKCAVKLFESNRNYEKVVYTLMQDLFGAFAQASELERNLIILCFIKFVFVFNCIYFTNVLKLNNFYVVFMGLGNN